MIVLTSPIIIILGNHIGISIQIKLNNFCEQKVKPIKLLPKTIYEYNLRGYRKKVRYSSSRQLRDTIK